MPPKESSERPSDMAEVVFYGPVEFGQVFAFEIMDIAGVSEKSISIEPGISYFTPNEQANPAAGERNTPQAEPEVRVSIAVPSKLIASLCDRLGEIHPYESFVIEVYEAQENKKKKLDDGRITLQAPTVMVDEIRSALSAEGAGNIGNYEACCFVTDGENGVSTITTIGNQETIEKAAFSLGERFPGAQIETVLFSRPSQFSGRQIGTRVPSQAEATLLLEAHSGMNARLQPSI